MFSGLESPTHLIIVLIVAMLVLGPKRLPQVGRSLGTGIRQFKASLEGRDEEASEQASKASEEEAGERTPSLKP
jgi:sec-independent protein translocase protein TatA